MRFSNQFAELVLGGECMKKTIKNYMKRISDFKYKSMLFIVGIILLIYLVTGLMLDTIHESQARTTSVIVVPK